MYERKGTVLEQPVVLPYSSVYSHILSVIKPAQTLVMFLGVQDCGSVGCLNSEVD